MKVTIKITITKEYKIQIKYIDSENKETTIKLSENDNEEIDPCISFNGNFISIGQQNENAIHFMQEWISKPEEYKLYSVMYQGKEYSVVSEVLFAVIITEYKRRIEREYIIENTII